MKPIRTPETNAVFNPAEGDEDHVEPMFAVAKPHDEIPSIMSTWQLSADERAQIAEGALIELGVAATSPPPVGMAVVAPFCQDCAERMSWSDELNIFVCPSTEP